MTPREYARWLRKQGADLPAAVAMPVFRRRAFRILQLAVQNSPVNFGTLRRGWHLTIGAASKQDIEAGKSDAGVLQKAQQLLAKVQLGEGVWIQNNVPYAGVYERGLFDPPNPGATDWGHITNKRVRQHLRKTRPNTVLIEGGFHVRAPRGMLADAVQQVAELAKAGQL